MRFVICNREGSLAENGWMHIVPRGTVPNEEAGIDQVLDDTSLDSIMAGFAQDRKRYGDKWPGLYFGVEHHIYDPSKSSEALAWGKEFQQRADGIWSKPELTDIGAEAIKNKRFKFTSFCCDPSDLESLGGNRYRVLRVETVGLTNLPNAKNLLTPITNRAGIIGKPESPQQLREWAAERIGALAAQELAANGGSLAGAWLRVMNREPKLAQSALVKS